MAAVSSGRSWVNVPLTTDNAQMNDRLKKLYPAVDEDKFPLPRAWSTKEKYNYIGLSQNNLRVHYKGHGKTHRDAASVQATHPIPAACGLYYFEVKIVSKGRDGYMGIGLSAHGVNMNRLPGWDKQSYGYHGDDGHSFCSSGTGQPYGPTFTTGDVIGCGVNLIDNTCFYTKNGHHLGTAFTDLPSNLYPTVGLQTPGEVVDANFGREPFMFDVEDMMHELGSRTRLSIQDFPVPESQGEWQAILNKMVSTYLIHHGYCNTAEAFTKITEQPFNEDMVSIKNRQKILKLVLAGRMGEAIERISRMYPGLLESNQNLLFMLKCRQFVEMVNGCDIEVGHSNNNKITVSDTSSKCSSSCSGNSRDGNSPLTCPLYTSTTNTMTTNNIVSPYQNGSDSLHSPAKVPIRANSPVQTSVIQSTKNYNNKNSNGSTDSVSSNNINNGEKHQVNKNDSSRSSSNSSSNYRQRHHNASNNTSCTGKLKDSDNTTALEADDVTMNENNTALNGSSSTYDTQIDVDNRSCQTAVQSADENVVEQEDIEMGGSDESASSQNGHSNIVIMDHDDDDVVLVEDDGADGEGSSSDRHNNQGNINATGDIGSQQREKCLNGSSQITSSRSLIESSAANLQSSTENKVCVTSTLPVGTSSAPVLHQTANDMHQNGCPANTTDLRQSPVPHAIHSSVVTITNTTTTPTQADNVPTQCDNDVDLSVDDDDDMMDVDVPICRKSCTKPAVERILEFGKELYSMSQKLPVDKRINESNQKMLENAFSLLAYSNPWASPVGWQLQPSERETVCASLNSAILESHGKPRRPPLEVALAHAQELVRLMAHSGLGSCAFASLTEMLE